MITRSKSRKQIQGDMLGGINNGSPKNDTLKDADAEWEDASDDNENKTPLAQNKQSLPKKLFQDKPKPKRGLDNSYSSEDEEKDCN